MTAALDDNHKGLLTRRSVVIGAAVSLIPAPAIVRVANLMAVRRFPFPFGRQYAGYLERLYLHALDGSLQTALRAGRATIELNGQIITREDGSRQVAWAQAHGFLPPYICIYRSS